MRQSVLRKDSFDIFKVKVTMKVLICKYYRFHCIFRAADPFATKLNLTVHDHVL